MKYINSIFIMLAVILVFSNTIFNGYNLDDQLVTGKNKLTEQNTENSIFQLFTSSYHEVGGFSYGYRPITIASFYLEYELFGESVTTSHLINLILYTILVLLIYQLLIRIFENSNPYLLLFIALLFAIHPIHSEVVASIKNRDEILSLLFFVGSAILAMNWASSKRIYALLGILLFATLSILSKKSTLPLLFMLPLFLLVKEKLTISQFLSLSCCFSVPIALFAYNFQWVQGVQLFLLMYFIYLSFYSLHFLYENQKIRTPNTFEIISFLLVILFLLIGVLYRDLLFFLTGLLFLITLFKNHFKQSLVSSLIASFVGFFIFYHTEFLIYSIIVLSTLAVKSRTDLKFNPIFFIPILICCLIIAYHKESWVSILIYLVPVLVISSALISRFLPLIISLLSIIASLVFFQINLYNVGLLLSALFVSQLLILIKWSKPLLAIWIFFSCASIIQKQQSQNSSIFTSENFLGQKELNIEERSSSLKEGRKLEFIENTLVAPHRIDQRLATGLMVLGEYFRLMVFPKELSFYYGYSKITTTDFSNYKVWLSLFCHVLLLFLSIYCINKQPLVGIGGFWYLSCIFIFSNLPVLVAGMVGERLAFCASLGFCIFVGGILNWIKPQFNYSKLRGLELFSLLLLFAFSVRTFARNEKWESHTKLMSNDIKHLDNSAQANYLLAFHTIVGFEQNNVSEELGREQLEKAIYHFKRATEIYPKYYNFHVDLGKAYIVVNDLENAKRSLVLAHNLEPEATFAMVELIKVCFELNQYNEVIRYGTKLLEKQKMNTIVTKLIAFSAYFEGDYMKSTEFTLKALEGEPQNEDLLRLYEENQLLISGQ